MAITYPLTPPTTPGNRSIQWSAKTIVGTSRSIFTGQQQVFSWPGQWWEFSVSLPSMSDLTAGPWQAFLLSLNGPEGTFNFFDSVRKIPFGTIAGAVTVGAAAAINTTTLPLTGGTGSFAVGDWLQVAGGAGSQLHRVLKVNVGSVDVFPKLRASYAAGTSIIYNSAAGLFRLTGAPSWDFNEIKVCASLSFSAVEVLA